MASAVPLQGIAESYYRRIRKLCPRDTTDIPLWPGLTSLRKFFEINHDCKNPPGISLVHIPGESEEESNFSIMSPKYPWDLLENLPSLADNTPSSQLIMVENICPTTLGVLGATYDIDPQFFADHVNVLSWYQMSEIVPERLSSLPSSKKDEEFLTLRYVETREIGLEDDSSADASSVLWPDLEVTRIRHSAGKLKPIQGRKGTFPLMAFTRQTVSVWCRRKKGDKGWISIMLLDPPFRLASGHGHVGQAEYRNPSLRPTGNEELHHGEIRHTFRRAFCHLLEQRCRKDHDYLRECSVDMFLVLYEVYRIISSEWLVVNEYVKRELASIERQLEKPASTFQELEQHLRELYRIRRRCNKDHELVTEAATQCKNLGQPLWPSTSTSTFGTYSETLISPTLAQKHAGELQKDLQYVLDNMSISISRIEKTTTLLNALVTISEGRQGLQENRGIAFLTLVATIFLPCETIATVLGIQTQYGPGADAFWMLWAVALPLTALVVLVPYLYPVGTTALESLRGRRGKRAKKVNKKVVRDTRAGAEWNVVIEGEDLAAKNDPMMHLRRMSVYGNV